MPRNILQQRQSELMNRQLELACPYHRTSMTIHTVCICQPWLHRVHKGWTNHCMARRMSYSSTRVWRRSHTNGYGTSPEMPLFLFVVSSAISPQREPPEPQRSPNEYIPGWIWHGARATCGGASRTTGPSQHCVALGGCQPNSFIGWSKTLYCSNMEFIPGIFYTR